MNSAIVLIVLSAKSLNHSHDCQSEPHSTLGLAGCLVLSLGHLCVANPALN